MSSLWVYAQTVESYLPLPLRVPSVVVCPRFTLGRLRRDASEDFLLRFLLGLAISRVSLPLLSSTAPLSPTEPTLAVVAVDALLRPGENRENKLMNRRCLGVFTSLFRDWGFLPLEGVCGLKSEPDLTSSAREGVKEAVVAMDQWDSEWIPASII